jgi:hypothetical protein
MLYEYIYFIIALFSSVLEKFIFLRINQIVVRTARHIVPNRLRWLVVVQLCSLTLHSLAFARRKA